MLHRNGVQSKNVLRPNRSNVRLQWSRTRTWTYSNSDDNGGDLYCLLWYKVECSNISIIINDLAASLSLWSSCTSWDFHQQNLPATAEQHWQQSAVDVGVWMPLHHWKSRWLQGRLVLSITYNTSISNTSYLHAGNTKMQKYEGAKILRKCWGHTWT